jgi:hypothetical protein
LIKEFISKQLKQLGRENEMAEYIENKWVVLKTEDIAKLPNTKRVLLDEIIGMIKAVRQAEGKPGMNEYLVCNKKEPYAEDVWKVISDGEDKKIAPCECDGGTCALKLGNQWFIHCNICGSLFGDQTLPGRLRGFISKEQAVSAWNVMRRHEARKDSIK